MPSAAYSSRSMTTRWATSYAGSHFGTLDRVAERGLQRRGRAPLFGQRRRRAISVGTGQNPRAPRAGMGLRKGRGRANTHPYGPTNVWSSLLSMQSTSSTVPRIAPLGDSMHSFRVSVSSSIAARAFRLRSGCLDEWIAMRSRTVVLRPRFSMCLRPSMMAHAHSCRTVNALVIRCLAVSRSLPPPQVRRTMSRASHLAPSVS